MVAHNGSDMQEELGGWIIYSAEHSSLSFEGGSSRLRLRESARHRWEASSRPHVRSHYCSGYNIAFNRMAEEVQAIQSCAQRVALDCVSLATVSTRVPLEMG